MKQFYALTAFAVFFSLQATAQYTQNFENSTSLTTGCTVVVNAGLTTDPLEVITGTSSLYSNPPVNGSGTRDYSTPYLNIVDPIDPFAATTSFTVSFNYKLTQALTGLATRTIEVGIQDPSGYSLLTTINLDKNNDPVVSTPFSQTFTVPTGPHRLVLKIGGSTGMGAARTIVDDIFASANPYYNIGGTCNAAPSIINDVYFSANYNPYTGISVLNNDSDPNGESLGVPVVTTPSPDGTVLMNDDGTFTFTPNLGFIGTTTTFSYTVYDKGFDPLSGTATVIINFGSGAALPVKLLSFQGSLVNSRVQLQWSVEENQTGGRFEIEKSLDGINYTTAGIMFATGRTGREAYLFNEASQLNGSAYYRLKLLNKDNSLSYSRVIFLKNGTIKNDAGIALLQNPIRSAISFSYFTDAAGMATVNLYNMTGARVQTFNVMMQKGSNTIARPIDGNVIAGTYILEVNTTSERRTIKLTK